MLRWLAIPEPDYPIFRWRMAHSATLGFMMRRQRTGFRAMTDMMAGL